VQQEEAFLSCIHAEMERRISASKKLIHFSELSNYSYALAVLQQLHQKYF
jgi:hypothetical protein